jgi:hypothetical protein
MAGIGPLIIVEKAEVIASGLPRPEVQREACPWPRCVPTFPMTFQFLKRSKNYRLVASCIL